jgi:hypothetical protein
MDSYSMNNAGTNIVAMDKKQRLAKAIRLRAAGVSLEEIMVQVGFSTIETLQRAISNALKKHISTAVEEYRAMENVRLDEILRVLWPRVLKGELTAMDRAFKVMERRARLMGLDQAPQVSQPDIMPQGVIWHAPLTPEQAERVLTHEQSSADHKDSVLKQSRELPLPEMSESTPPIPDNGNSTTDPNDFEF